jgi:Arc/MetJ-type ribon-helix-helix transcriptional regulator
MVRTQIQLEEETLEEVKRVAAEESRSVAEVIRESVKGDLARRSMRKRADRLLGLAGRYGSGLGDLARRHDEYLKDGF